MIVKQWMKLALGIGVGFIILFGLTVWPLFTQNGSLVLVYQTQALDGSSPFTHIYVNVGNIIIHNPGNVYNPWGGNSLITDLWRVVNPPADGTIDLAASGAQQQLSLTNLPFGQYTQLVIMINGVDGVDSRGVKHQLQGPSQVMLLLGSPGKDASVAYQDAGIHIHVGQDTVVLLIFTVDEALLLSSKTLVINAHDQVLTGS